MADEKSPAEQGSIERAQRLHDLIDTLKKDQVDVESGSEGKSLKEQIEERARKAALRENPQDSE